MLAPPSVVDPAVTCSMEAMEAAKAVPGGSPNPAPAPADRHGRWAARWPAGCCDRAGRPLKVVPTAQEVAMAIRPNQTSPVVRAGIYTRISWDPAGHRAGGEGQRADYEAHCAERGWELARLRGQRPLGLQRQATAGLRADAGGCRGAPPRRRRDLAQRPAASLASGAGGLPRPRGAQRGASGGWSAAATTTSRRRRGGSRPASSGQWLPRSRRTSRRVRREASGAGRAG